MTELLKTLCALPGPSGCEDAVREFVLKRQSPLQMISARTPLAM